MTRFLMAIGGAEKKSHNNVIFKTLISLAGGRDARVVILPIASSIPLQRQKIYERIFRAAKVYTIDTLHIMSRHEAFQNEHFDLLHKATLIFFTGGDQLKITSLLGGTPIEEVLHERYQQGCIIAGTSAGAACLGEFMIYQQPNFKLYRKGGLEVSKGLHFIPNALFDTHFVKRSRISRLVHFVATNPSTFGIGIEDNTALLVANETMGYVLGSGTVIVLDGREAYFNNIAEVENGNPFGLANVKYSVLVQGMGLELPKLHAVKFETLPIEITSQPKLPTQPNLTRWLNDD